MSPKPPCLGTVKNTRYGFIGINKGFNGRVPLNSANAMSSGPPRATNRRALDPKSQDNLQPLQFSMMIQMGNTKSTRNYDMYTSFHNNLFQLHYFFSAVVELHLECKVGSLAT